MQDKYVDRDCGETRSISAFSVTAVSAISVLICLYTAAIWLPTMPFSLPGQAWLANSDYKRFTAQGWAFFTKSPRDDTYEFYRVSDRSQIEHVGNAPFGAPKNFFGLDRRVRKESMEYAALLSQVQNSDWRECKTSWSLVQCVQSPVEGKRSIRSTVENKAPSPIFCGDMEVVRSRIVPWAWKDISPNRTAPAATVSLSARCKED